MSTAVFTKNAIPVPPATGDIRMFLNNDGIWCSIDENGVVIVYQNSLTTNTSKAGVVAAGSFSGNPKMASVTFTNDFPDNNYAVVITGADNRNWTAESLTLSGFIINSNANQPLIGNCSWNATHTGS